MLLVLNNTVRELEASTTKKASTSTDNEGAILP